MVARHFLGMDSKIFYYRNHFEVDLIATKQKEVIPVEIKNKERVEKADFKGLISFMKRFNIKEGLLLCRSFSGTEKTEGIIINIRPFWSWLLKLDS
jgi:predicted AAA+ superfamily ATPase